MRRGGQLHHWSRFVTKHMMQIYLIAIGPERRIARFHQVHIRRTVVDHTLQLIEARRIECLLIDAHLNDGSGRVNQGVVLIDLAAKNAIRATRQAEGINPSSWIGRVLINVDTAREPDRVFREEAPGAGIGIPMPVIV